mgnify:CR=1 FL=1
MSALLIVILGVGSLALYFSMKIFSNKCRPDFPIEIQNHIQIIEDEVPPKYEDIVNTN